MDLRWVRPLCSRLLVLIYLQPSQGIAAGMCTIEVSFWAALIQIQPSWDISISSTRYPTPGYLHHSRSLVRTCVKISTPNR